MNTRKHARELVKVLGYIHARDHAISRLHIAEKDGFFKLANIWREILVQILALK
jgi:hypothetical protein